MDRHFAISGITDKQKSGCVVTSVGSGVEVRGGCNLGGVGVGAVVTGVGVVTLVYIGMFIVMRVYLV